MSQYEHISREELIRAYERVLDERNKLINALADIADDRDGHFEFSYAPAVADSTLVGLGYRKRWEDR